MLTMAIKYIYLFNALILASMILYGKMFVFRKKHPGFVSDYCAAIAVVLCFYVLISLLFAWILPSTVSKLVMLGFAVSPFLLGLVASYNTEKYYTFIQILLIILSVLYVML